MLARWGVALVLLALVGVVLTAVLRVGAGGASTLPERRAVSLGFEDVAVPDQDWASVTEHLEQVRANAVVLAAGRPEWTAFPWPEHPERVSGPVRDSGRDLLGEAIDAVGEDSDGDRRHVSLVVDALVPLMIERDPELAGQEVGGERSTLFASAAALRGTVGDALVETVAHLAATYDVDEIALTELMFDDATFGARDLALWRTMTGRDDWPRTDAGEVDTRAHAIGAWRSQVLADLLGRLRAAAGDVDLAVDVRASWEDPVRGRSMSGHDLSVLEGSVDRFVVWNYFALAGRGPGDSELLTRGLRAGGIDLDRVTISVGLWAPEGSAGETGLTEADGADLAGSGQALARITPDALAEAARASATHGTTSVAVTPVLLMTPEHWSALAEVWDTADG